MQPNRPLVSTHRLARLTRWAHLWFAAGLTLIFSLLNDKRRVRRRLDAMARTIGCLVFLGVAAHMPPPRPRAIHRHGCKKQRGLLRALIGKRLRRSLAGKDAFARLAAMACVLRDLDLHIAELTKRLRLGLTRRRAVRNAIASARSTHDFLAVAVFNSS